MMHNLVGVAALAAIAGLIWYAFRQASGVKRDLNNRNDWSYFSGDDNGGGDGGGGHHHS
jgi:hypothetical protein